MTMYFDPAGNPVEDTVTWANMMEKPRHVRDTHVGRYRISTVFLGLNHAFGEGPPLIYETMVFDQRAKANRWNELECRRYTTYDQALEGHRAMVAQFSKRGRRTVEYELDLMEAP